MRIVQEWRRAGRALLIGSAALACVAATAAADAPQAAAAPAAPATFVHLCRSARHAHHAKLANQLSRAIERGLHGRKSHVGLEVDDPHLGITCTYHAAEHFTSASAVKTIILGALMLEEGHIPHGYQATLATKMITRSNNKAADALWVQVGMTALQHFLNRAHMYHTGLGQNGLWGLTELTSHDETTLMWLLMKPGKVLTNAERRYELHLMAKVVPWQRWGVSAGAPTNFTLHIKNGWAPDPTYDWRVNSTGCFTRGNGTRDYSMVILTNHDGHHRSGMTYGITTVERVASRVNRDLTPTSRHLPARTHASPSWGIPDEPAAAWRA